MLVSKNHSSATEQRSCASCPLQSCTVEVIEKLFEEEMAYLLLGGLQEPHKTPKSKHTSDPEVLQKSHRPQHSSLFLLLSSTYFWG